MKIIAIVLGVVLALVGAFFGLRWYGNRKAEEGAKFGTRNGWKTAGEPATDGQKKYATDLGVWKDGMTRSQVSEAIDAALKAGKEPAERKAA